MYGIVNKAIEELITANFGAEKWEAVKNRSGIDVDFFISNEPYDDELTFRLAQAASLEMNLTLQQVFLAFGEWWVLKTSKEKYGSLMATGGNSLKDFLLNMPTFHNRIMLIYPKLTPPEFRITHEEENSLHLHYFSKRNGLQDFVIGLLSGLGKMYSTPVSVEIVMSKESGEDHEVFKVSW